MTIDPVIGLQCQATSSFGFTPPASSVSRAPTRHYDRESKVIVVDSSDEHLKFLKMHLNRYFSKISVFSSGSEAYKALKESPFDVVIVEGAPVKKSISDFLKKLSDRFRHIPVVMTKASESPPFTSGDYPGILVVDIIFKSFAMDPLHVAIRRAMNTRDLLRELAALLAPDAAIGKVVRTAQLLDLSDRRQSLVEEIRKRLTEEIAD